MVRRKKKKSQINNLGLLISGILVNPKFS